MIAPNSVVGVPAQTGPGSTTIIQQSGSILIEVEKSSGKHFEVETPYLAAVVKGTQFRVSVGQGESYVSVLRGQVEVTDFRSGQSALVLPGQMAKVWTIGNAGLSLSGPGTLSPIRRERRAQRRLCRSRHRQRTCRRRAGTEDSLSCRRVVRPGHSQRRSKRTRPTTISGMRAQLRGQAFRQGRRRTDARTSVTAAIIAIPLGFGAVIAVAVAAKRRRQKQKQK